MAGRRTRFSRGNTNTKKTAVVNLAEEDDAANSSSVQAEENVEDDDKDEVDSREDGDGEDDSSKDREAADSGNEDEEEDDDDEHGDAEDDDDDSNYSGSNESSKRSSSVSKRKKTGALAEPPSRRGRQKGTESSETKTPSKPARGGKKGAKKPVSSSTRRGGRSHSTKTAAIEIDEDRNVDDDDDDDNDNDLSSAGDGVGDPKSGEDVDDGFDFDGDDGPPDSKGAVTPSSKRNKSAHELSAIEEKNSKPAKTTPPSKVAAAQAKPTPPSQTPSKTHSNVGDNKDSEDDFLDIVLPNNIAQGTGECTLLVQIDPEDSAHLDLEGATGAVGRLETDDNGVVLDLKGCQYRGKIFPGPTAMILSSVFQLPHKKQQQQNRRQQLKVDGITDEFCRLIKTGDAMTQLNASVLQGDVGYGENDQDGGGDDFASPFAKPANRKVEDDGISSKKGPQSKTKRTAKSQIKVKKNPGKGGSFKAAAGTSGRKRKGTEVGAAAKKTASAGAGSKKRKSTSNAK